MLTINEIPANTNVLHDDTFDALAQELLECYTLVINSSTYRIIEIEFYLNNIEGTLDPFTHNYISSKPPYENGQLRWHRSGVDIILRKGDLYGSVLLRALKRNDEEIIRGPHKVLEEIFKNFSIHSRSTIGFNRLEASSSVRYFKSSRQGLSLKSHFKRGLEYIHKPWRYLTIPIDSIKDKRGIYFNLLEQEMEDGNEIIPIDSSTIENYKKLIEEGEQLSETEVLQLVGTSIDEQARVFGYCKKHFKY